MKHRINTILRTAALALLADPSGSRKISAVVGAAIGMVLGLALIGVGTLVESPESLKGLLFFTVMMALNFWLVEPCIAKGSTDGTKIPWRRAAWVGALVGAAWFFFIFGAFPLSGFLGLVIGILALFTYLAMALVSAVLLTLAFVLGQRWSAFHRKRHRG
jgi:hypothetical protein